VGSPVWAFKPTPAANAAVAALTGCEGKKGIAFITSGGGPRNSLEVLKSHLEGRGVKVGAVFHFTDRELDDAKKIGEFADAIRKISGEI
ncbi:MAG TPA: ArsR family transcriptional regulator, partial [Methanomicrobiales archaeon]|nr:ArsR family transcriptional regulator [Methanomicrobiales archaeon]